MEGDTIIHDLTHKFEELRTAQEAYPGSSTMDGVICGGCKGTVMTLFLHCSICNEFDYCPGCFKKYLWKVEQGFVVLLFFCLV